MYFHDMDSLNTKKKELRNMLPNEGIVKTIASLKALMREESKKNNTLLLIESHFKEIRSRQQQGIISWDVLDLGKNGTRKKLLDFIDDLEWRDTKLTVFTDPRDGQTYRTVKLLGKIWLAENLNYDTGDNCWFYANDPKNGEKYGRLYTWDAAMKACPPGWRLPEDEEIISLLNHYSNKKATYKALIEGGVSGFNALLGGLRDTGGSFLTLGAFGFYWSATERDGGFAYGYFFFGVNQTLGRDDGGQGLGFSVRCLQD